MTIWPTLRGGAPSQEDPILRLFTGKLQTIASQAPSVTCFFTIEASWFIKYYLWEDFFQLNNLYTPEI